MRRIDRLIVVAAIATCACKSKASKQAELAAADLDRLEKLIADRHVASLPDALTSAAKTLSPSLDDDGAKLEALRTKSEALSAAKRSFYALVDRDGQIVYVDESGWKSARGRLVRDGFPPVGEVLDGNGGKAFARGIGRFGGDPPGVTFFVDAAAIPGADPSHPAGALVAIWEAHDAADDLEAALLTLHGMETASTKKHVDLKEQRKKAMEGDDAWVALFRGAEVYFPEESYQPLEEAAKQLDLGKKTSGGRWTGTFEVLNTGWGAAAERVPALGDDVGVVVMRHRN